MQERGFVVENYVQYPSQEGNWNGTGVLHFKFTVKRRMRV